MHYYAKYRQVATGIIGNLLRRLTGRRERQGKISCASCPPPAQTPPSPAVEGAPPPLMSQVSGVAKSAHVAELTPESSR